MADTAVALRTEISLAANWDIGTTLIRMLRQSLPVTSMLLPTITVATADVMLFAMYEHARPMPTTDDDTAEKQSPSVPAQSQTKLDTDDVN